ncbi:GntR family transcriptional regulator [Veronia pacifica]|uniref:GntR family transcriptional regulator n=1 Tax=Veronia pacifica TaxID=1080227 RepID=A0A1C3EJ75_9GAMM|nr:GntR family transcriptional regulator [Veronia pacifica]ODA33285.1 GntR family transcriptional regulator [Veronia pacifica]
MKIELDQNDPTPKFRQLIEQVRRLIVGGHLRPGQKLISVRKLAAELKINPMTISRCYQQLEQEGWLERQRGVGMVVAASGLKEKMQDRFSLIENPLRALILDAREVGYSRSELMMLVMQNWGDED